MSIPYVSYLPVSDHTFWGLVRLLAAERERIGTRKGTRALSCVRQATVVLRWFCDGAKVRRLCEDHGISRSVCYRAIHEGRGLLAWQAPGLRNALIAARFAGYDHVIVDGTLVETDRLSMPGPTKGVDLWWAKKAHNHAGNIQVVTAPDDGFPLWVSDVRPGREHDLTALRACGALALLDEWTGDGCHQVLFDLGYEGCATQEGPLAIPFKKPKGGELTGDQKGHNRIHNALRAVGERGNALLKGTFGVLRNVTIDPWKIGSVVKACLVLLHMEHQRTT
ncbi:transposase family protein [Frankia tisae]|uniref:transposase family protein n=1 Tax=Frankia tisae TaxID=2950104 RepID=UPI0021C09E90|nr:transposase family protein [Frankia tisae]